MKVHPTIHKNRRPLCNKRGKAKVVEFRAFMKAKDRCRDCRSQEMERKRILRLIRLLPS